MDKRKKRVRLRPVLLGAVLIGYTVFTLLDAFVIPRDIVSVESVQAAGGSYGTAGQDASKDSGSVKQDSDNMESDSSGNSDNMESDSSGNSDDREIDGKSSATVPSSADQDGQDAGSGRKHRGKPGGGKHGGPGSGKGGPGSQSADDGDAGKSSNQDEAESDSSSPGGSSGSSSQNSSSAGRSVSSQQNSSAGNGGSSSQNSSSAGSSGSSSQSSSAATNGAASADTYSADGVTITLTEERVADTQVYIADIQLDDPGDLLSGLANNSFGRNISQTTSDIADTVGVVLAINGDYYGFRDTGYVMRNGYLYRSTARSGSGNEDLVVYSDGTMEIIDESEVTAEELQKNVAVQIYSFGPALVNGGAVTVSAGDEVDQSMRSNPRTAIGMVGPGHYIMVVSDGRTSESAGLSLAELAQVMKDQGCTVAYNLDGGGSTTMWFNGEVVNNPTTNGNSIKERKVSDIVYIAK